MRDQDRNPAQARQMAVGSERGRRQHFPFNRKLERGLSISLLDYQQSHRLGACIHPCGNRGESRERSSCAAQSLCGPIESRAWFLGTGLGRDQGAVGQDYELVLTIAPPPIPAFTTYSSARDACA